MRLLIVAHLRGLLRTPLQSLLAVVGIALAVTVVFGVDLALGGARAGFDYAWRQLHGEATHYVAATSGETFAESHYVELRRRWRAGAPDLASVRSMTPVVHAEVNLDAGGALLLLGIDLVGGSPESRKLFGLASSGAMLSRTGSVMLSRATAERLAVASGDSIGLRIGSRDVRAHVVGLLGAVGDPRFDDLVLADIATAQELLEVTGRLHRIELVLSDTPSMSGLRSILDRLFPGISPTGASNGARWRPALPVGLRAYAIKELELATRSLVDAFYFNLGALSLLAMLVALFLINQTMHLSVVRRSVQMGRLRALGITSAELQCLIVAEALVMGIAGTAVGLLGGWLLAGQLLALVTRTVSDLYFVLSVSRLELDAVVLMKSILLGVSVSVLAAWWPARRGAAAAVVEQTRRIDQERRLRPARTVILASLVLGLGWLLIRWDASGIVGALVAVGALLLGAAMLMTPVIHLVSHLFALPGRWLGHIGRMSARQLRRNLSRAGVAVAALMIAAAASLGMGVMIDSFRASLDGWLSERLVADVYLEGTSDHPFTEAFASELLALDGISGITLYGSAAELSEGRRVRLSVMSERGAVNSRYVMLEGERTRGALIVSESLSVRHDKSVGDFIVLDSPSREVELRVAGVFREYGSGQGRVVMDAELYRRHWGEPQFRAAALFGEGAAFATSLEALESRDDLRLRRRENLRRYSLEVFDRTFAVTLVLRWLVLVVAFVGIQSALLAVQLDRGREFALAHALGFTRRELASLALLDAVALGLCAGVMALPVGAGVSWLLVHVVNVRAFGWTLALSFDPVLFGETLFVAALAGLLAGLTPALKLWRQPPDIRAIPRES